MTSADLDRASQGASARLQPARERLTLRELRKARKLSLRDLEPLVGISRGTLSQIENGTRLAKTEQLEMLAAFYGVPFESAQFAVVVTFEVGS